MRKEFIDGLCELAERDEKIVLLTGDLGYKVLDEFVERFPDRFYNVGVAEQNMVGVATGLAGAGMRPYVYSIATFASMRPYEFIRNGPVLHDLPVTVVGVGGGLDYGHNGATHFALEDVGLMRLLPGMAVIAPADPAQALAATIAAHELSGPAYLRLGKSEATVPGLDGRFRLGRAETIGDGEDLAIFSYGTLADRAVRMAQALEEEAGLRATVAITSCISPAPRDDLRELLDRVPLAVSVENVHPNGGVGSLLCEIVAEDGLDTRVLRRGVERPPLGRAGDPDFLYAEQGLSVEALAREVAAALDLSV